MKSQANEKEEDEAGAGKIVYNKITENENNFFHDLTLWQRVLRDDGMVLAAELNEQRSHRPCRRWRRGYGV